MEEVKNNLSYNVGEIDINNLENAKIENGLKINTSKKIKEEKEFNGIVFSNVELKSEKGESVFTALITNNTSKKYENLFLKANFVDKKGNKLNEIIICVPDFNPNDSKSVTSTLTDDIINAYNYTIEETEM